MNSKKIVQNIVDFDESLFYIVDFSEINDNGLKAEIVGISRDIENFNEDMDIDESANDKKNVIEDIEGDEEMGKGEDSTCQMKMMTDEEKNIADEVGEDYCYSGNKCTHKWCRSRRTSFY